MKEAPLKKIDYLDAKSFRISGVYDSHFFDYLQKEIHFKPENRKAFEDGVVSAAQFYINMKHNNSNPLPNSEQNNFLKPIEKKAQDLEDVTEGLSNSIFATAKLYEAFKAQASKNDNSFETHFAKSLLVSGDKEASYDSDSLLKLIRFIKNSAQKAQEIELGREGGKEGEILHVWVRNMRSLWSDYLPNENFSTGKVQEGVRTNRTPEVLLKIIQKIDPTIELTNILTAIRKK